jgi:integrase
LAIISLRPSEIFAVMGRNVGPGFIHIQNSLSKHRELDDTKTGRDKYISLPPELDDEIHCFMTEHGVGPNDLLFTTRTGTPLSVKNFLRRRLRPAARRAAITTLDVDFQMLRRSFATLAGAISGGDAKSIQTQMGHARPDMWLLEYAQPVDEMRRRLLERMERILLGKEPVSGGFDRQAGLETGELGAQLATHDAAKNVLEKGFVLPSVLMKCVPYGL